MVDKYKIEFATEQNIEEILLIYQSFYYGLADWDEQYPNVETIKDDLEKNSLIIMKNDNDEIIAAVSIDDEKEVDVLKCWGIEPSMELSRICVKKEYQNQGLSRIIINFAINELKKSGTKGIRLLVRKGNIPALKAYLNQGFRIVGECNLFERDFDCLEKEIY